MFHCVVCARTFVNAAAGACVQTVSVVAGQTTVLQKDFRRLCDLF